MKKTAMQTPSDSPASAAVNVRHQTTQPVDRYVGKWTVFDSAGLDRQAWQNSHGTTREISRGALAGLDSNPAQQWAWRISLADLEANVQFSTFVGVDRTAILVGDAPVALISDVERMEFRRQGDIHHFSGELSLACELEIGSARLLNVMVRRHVAAATVTVTNEKLVVPAAGKAVNALLVLNGSYIVNNTGQAANGVAPIHLTAEMGMISGEGAAGQVAIPSSPGSCLVSILIQPPEGFHSK